MNSEQLEKVRQGKGFVAALDQSGGSTPKALKLYGIPSDRYSSEEEMFDLVHEREHLLLARPRVALDAVEIEGLRRAAAALVERSDEAVLRVHLPPLLLEPVHDQPRVA